LPTQEEEEIVVGVDDEPLEDTFPLEDQDEEEPSEEEE